jgi:hypothetical protein
MSIEVSHPSRAVKLVNGTTWKGRRKHRRKAVLWSARLKAEEGAFDCVAFDLSLGGVKLRLNARIALHRPVKLVLERFGALEGELVWRRAGTIGLRFLTPPDEVGRLLGESLSL